MPVKYKQLCFRCKKRYVPVMRGRNNFVVCQQCQVKEASQDVEDVEMKKFFDIPAEFYEKNSFLRDIKINYLKFGDLTEAQKKAFLETVEKLKQGQ